MAVLKSCPKHNMVAYLEKTDGNAEFQEIIDFLTRSSIHYALTAIFDAIKLMGMRVKSERPSKPQPTPSPHYPSEAHVKPQSDPSPGPSPTIPILDPIPEGSGGNLRSHNSNLQKSNYIEGQSNNLDMDIDDTMDYTLAQDKGKTDKVDEKGESTAQSVLILKPLPKIDPNDKGKKRIEEDKESEEITEAKKNFDQIAHDEEGFYEKVKEFDDSFITIGSTEDERKIKEMNEGASDLDNKKKFVKEDVSTKYCKAE
ncbi:hypothetical protein Tco_1284523 [Tanacetum coccineum]